MSVEPLTPVAKQRIQQTKQGIQHEKRAYMFYVTSKPYACSVMVFAERFELFKKDPSIDILTLVSGLDSATIKRMNGMGIKTENVEVHYSTGDTNEFNRELYKDSNTKLQIFKDWGYDKFVFLDADSILMGNIDHLFDLPDVPTFWAPRAFWLEEKYQPAFTSILIVGKPSKSIFDASVALSKQDDTIYDMDILNKLYRHQIGMLPNIYAILNRHLIFRSELPGEYEGNYDNLKKDLMLVHFTTVMLKPGDYGKPWSSERGKPKKIEPGSEYYYEIFDTFYPHYDRVCS
ncbi:hypothetical protein HDV01_001621 [Terramyces sp. JEL0728]|nr:hypothetical protein HDV01_001621 [Terramyces sp. JEL0728]